MESSRARFDLTVLICILGLVMLATAHLWGPVETSEARYAEISREMVRSGDWMHPTLLNIHHYHKPPLTYWITAVSYSIFGVNAFATRFFLVIAFCTQIIIVFKLARLLFKDPDLAYYAAVIYATLPLVLISIRGLTTDAYLNLFVLLSLYCSIRFLYSTNISFFFVACFSMGLGFMTKGPVILIVPPFAIAGLWSLLPRPHLNLFQFALGSLIFLVTGFFWFGYLIKENPLFADYFFFHHLVDRVAHAEVFSRKEPWYYYLPILPLVTIPWIVVFAREIFTRKTGGEDGILSRRILLWWFVIPLVIFSIASSKLVLYILPLSIGFSFVTAYGATSISRQSQLFYVLLTSLVYVILMVFPFFMPQMNGELPLVIIPAVCLVLSVGLTFVDLPLPRVVTLMSTLFSLSLLLYSSFAFHFNSDNVNTITPVANFIKQKDLQKRQIMVYNELLPSLAFELDKDIVSLNDGNSSLNREVQFEQDNIWKASLVNATEQPGMEAIESLLGHPSVIVTKSELPPSIQSIMKGSWQKQTVGKWTLYYNK